MTTPATAPATTTSSGRGGSLVPIRARFGNRYRGVRWREDGFEMRCDACPSGARYWPLTPEFWNVKHGMSRCAACWLVYWRRSATTRRNADVELVRARDRAKYRRNRKVIILKRRVYYETHREQILARRRAWYHARKAA